MYRQKDRQKCTECGIFKDITTDNYRKDKKMRGGFRRQCKVCENLRDKIRQLQGKQNRDVVMIFDPLSYWIPDNKFDHHVFLQMLKDDLFADGSIVQFHLTDEFYRLKEQNLIRIRVKSKYEAHAQSRLQPA